MENKRRGRPRKYPNDPLFSFEDKPREECSYKDFFPDLNIKEPLPITRSVQPLNQPSESTVSDSTEKQKGHEGELLTPVHKLPIVSFKKIESTNPTTESFQRPENHYIRYIEPTESELFETVEYDMDEQDEAWLQIYNSERQKENLGQISCDLFENVIDQLEKEWFDLTKGLPKKTNDEPALPEDSTCAICDDSECENSNAIVFCDGCNLAVHQDCYGIPYIPEGQWLCRKCMVSPENPVSCIFCPGEGGALKQTTTNQWGHLLCAIWIPEVGLGNSVYMEPIDNIENVPKSRWKLTCYICRKRHGACIQCDNKHCFVAFHVTCARWARLCMRMKLHGTHYDGVALKAYCDRHTPKDYREIINVDKTVADAQRWFTDPKRKKMNAMPKKRYIDEENDQDDLDVALNTPTSDAKNNKKQRRQQAVTQLLPASKAARAHQHEYSAGAPIAPDYILHKLENLKKVLQATHLKKKQLAIASICRYWSLKRESRRGAPLLKRLHLEPWTASASQLKQTEVEKAHKASSMIMLRADLDKLRLLSEQVQKREKYKLDKIRKQKAYLEMILYPVELVLQPVLDQLIEQKELFRYPVTKDIASDYHDIIKSPMSFNDIIEKLSSHIYLTLDEFEADLSLIWKNSMLYNKKDTLYYKLAQRLEKATYELLETARISYQGLKIGSKGFLDVAVDDQIFSYGDDLTKKPDMAMEDTSSLDAIDTGRRLSLKRTNSGTMDEPVKKARFSSPESDQAKPKVARVTRSRTENNKRALRSRSITKDMNHPVKTSKVSKSVHESAKKPKLTTQKRRSPSQPISVERKVKFEHGELVWARVRGFPPHPATIVDIKKRKDIPENLLLLKDDSDKVLVEFLQVSEAHTWGWVEREYIYPFGDSKIDTNMILLAKRTKKSYRIKEVRNGYEYACELIHKDPMPQIRAVFKKC
ncbi:hypothetical protein MFLAVUS_004831 [Mucor flavus]|uniref:Peregrin n=1 Tax=Mucor flavus TaxID=439312 RepID=A0ABP9YX14_9FUNG